MSEFRVGDKVWVPCTVQAISSENTLSLDFTPGWWSPDAVLRHVAPPEPVTLTAEEWESFEDYVICAGPQDVINWLSENGFALVRTGGTADGA